MDSPPPDRPNVQRPPSDGNRCGTDEGTRFGFRTACWLRIAFPTFAIRAVLAPLPQTRLLRHGDFLHVLYDVDAWSRAGCLTREDVVARLRSTLFTEDMSHDLALGHFVCETPDSVHDNDEIRDALRWG